MHPAPSGGVPSSRALCWGSFSGSQGRPVPFFGANRNSCSGLFTGQSQLLPPKGRMSSRAPGCGSQAPASHCQPNQANSRRVCPKGTKRTARWKNTGPARHQLPPTAGSPPNSSQAINAKPKEGHVRRLALHFLPMPRLWTRTPSPSSNAITSNPEAVLAPPTNPKSLYDDFLRPCALSRISLIFA